jgi:hypothetical protein
MPVCSRQTTFMPPVAITTADAVPIGPYQHERTHDAGGADTAQTIEWCSRKKIAVYKK